MKVLDEMSQRDMGKKNKKVENSAKKIIKIKIIIKLDK
jgi:hypothetical protein